MIKIIDNLISEQLRKDLVHDEEYQQRPMGMYTFWDMKDFNNPKSKIEIALHHIWKDLINPEDFPEGGIEWWINKSNGPAKNRWHLDVVEAEQQTEYNSAHLTVAYYPYVDCIGGYLELLDNEKSKSKTTFDDIMRKIDIHTEVERFKPVTNRGIFYESFRIHRVAAVYSGIRECIASSVWKKKPLTFNNKSSYNYK